MAEKEQRNPSKRSSSKQRGPVKRSLSKRIFYWSVRLSSQFLGVYLFHLRSYNRELIPDAGSGLILSTHQSHFDPVLIGVTFNERLNYLARRTLFNNRLFGAAISLLDAIELDRDRSGLAGLKETMQRLKRGEKVLIFPEGTRSSDGNIAPLKPGFLSVARRSKAPLIPVAIKGAFDALPRGSKVPLRTPLSVVVGDTIQPEDIQELSDDEILALVAERLHACRRIADARKS